MYVSSICCFWSLIATFECFFRTVTMKWHFRISCKMKNLFHRSSSEQDPIALIHFTGEPVRWIFKFRYFDFSSISTNIIFVEDHYLHFSGSHKMRFTNNAFFDSKRVINENDWLGISYKLSNLTIKFSQIRRRISST